MSDKVGLPRILKKYVPSVNVALFGLAKLDKLPVYKKDNTQADQLRLEGNRLFEYKSYDSAVESYSKSIAIAEFATSSMALAYCNRAAVLFKLKYYKECLADINRALENGYSEDKIAKMRGKVLTLKDEHPVMFTTPTPPEIPVDKKNPTIECAADCVEIRKIEQMGRGVVATRDIQLGEVLAVEKAFAAAVVYMNWCHCHECGIWCMNTIPCQTCSTAMFCSEDCREMAWQKYHQYECKILPAFSLIEKCRLQTAIKVALSIKDYQNLFTSQDSDYNSDRAYEIVKLSSNCERKKGASKAYAFVLVAKVYTMLKDYTTFFNKLKSNRDKDTFKAVMVHLIFVSQNNDFEVMSELYPQEKVGSIIFPFMCLLNHSCIPNACIKPKNTRHVLIAKENIKKGEQILISYLYTYDAVPKSDRQKFLRENYYFICRCQACLGDWPIRTYLKICDEARYKYLTCLDMKREQMDITPERLKKELARLSSEKWVKPSEEYHYFTFIVDEIDL